MYNEELMENELNEVAGGWAHETIAIYAAMRKKGLLEGKHFFTMASSVAHVLADKFGMDEILLRPLGRNEYKKGDVGYSHGAIMDMINNYHA